MLPPMISTLGPVSSGSPFRLQSKGADKLSDSDVHARATRLPYATSRGGVMSKVSEKVSFVSPPLEYYKHLLAIRLRSTC